MWSEKNASIGVHIFLFCITFRDGEIAVSFPAKSFVDNEIDVRNISIYNKIQAVYRLTILGSYLFMEKVT